MPTSMPTTSKRSASKSGPFRERYCSARERMVACLWEVTASSGSPKASGVFGDSFVSENQDEDIFVTQDQIQLPVTGAVVALDELVSLLQQVAQRELFAPRAGEAFAQGPTPA